MTWISSPLRAAIAGALTSAPLGYLAHKRKWRPFTYDSAAEGAAFAAALGAISGVAWYWGIERAVYQQLGKEKHEPEPEVIAFAERKAFLGGGDEVPPGFKSSRFACSGSSLSYYGIAAFDPSGSALGSMMYLGTWRGDTHNDAQRIATEAGFRAFWGGFFPNGIWAMGQNCNAEWGAYRVA